LVESGVVLDACHSGLYCSCEPAASMVSYTSPITGVLTSSGLAEVEVDEFAGAVAKIYERYGEADVAPMDGRVTFSEATALARATGYFGSTPNAGKGWMLQGNGTLFRAPADGLVRVFNVLARPFFAPPVGLVKDDEVVVTSNP